MLTLKKQTFGTEMAHISTLTVPYEYREPNLCAIWVPVRGIFEWSIGTDMTPLYIPLIRAKARRLAC